MLGNFAARVISRLRRQVWGNFYPEITTVSDLQRALVLSPHPDDDVIGMGGTLKQLIDRAEVRIVYLTDGQLGSPGMTFEETGLTRRKEALAAAELIGCKSLDFLGMMDGHLRATGDAVANLRQIIKTFQPDAVFVPFFYDLHPDHAHAAHLLAKALEGYSGDLDCWSYEVWSPLTPNRIVDISNEMELKLAAINMHRSQIQQIDYCKKVQGLNTFRSILVPGASFAEAFYVCHKREFVRLARKLGLYT